MLVDEISISTVLYHTDLSMLRQHIVSLIAAAKCASERYDYRYTLYLVDNSAAADYFAQLLGLVSEFPQQHGFAIKPLQMSANLGYGVGNNQVIKTVTSRYHLIINPDVLVNSDALLAALEFIQNNNAVGLIAPLAVDNNNHPHYIAKAYPDVLTLILRVLNVDLLNRWFVARLSAYELRQYLSSNKAVTVPIASGCFMFCDTKILQSVGAFDESYFLYFEDFQLSLDIARHAQVMFVPSIKIIHSGGQAARKGLWHIAQFMRSGIQFFNKNGWRLW